MAAGLNYNKNSYSLLCNEKLVIQYADNILLDQHVCLWKITTSNKTSYYNQEQNSLCEVVINTIE